MGWVRVSDDFYDHEKFDLVSVLGIGMWIAGLAYANRNLTNGYVSRRAMGGLVSMLGIGLYTSNFSGKDAEPSDAADELVNAGLWHVAGHDCGECPQPGPRDYYIHDYLTYQPSREEVEEKREATRKRVEKHRTNARSNSVTNGVSTTPPKSQSQGTSTKTSKSQSRSNRASVSTDAVEVSEMTQRLSGQRGIQLPGIVSAIAQRCGIDITADQAWQVSLHLLDKAPVTPDAPQRYVLACIDQSTAEVQQWLYEQGIAS